MFNFLKKNKSQPAQAAEDVRFDAFKEHWKQVKAVLEATGPWSTGTRNIDSIEASISSVRANLLSLTELLVAELRETPNLGPIMEFCLIENLFKRLCVWALQPGAYQIERVVDQLRMYEVLVADSARCILHDKPLLQPLFALLAYHQTSPVNFEADELVSQLLQSLCLWIGRDPTLLPVFFCVSQEDQGPAGFLLFSLLLSYVYRDGQVGNRARDSLLLIFSHSARCDEVSEYITNNSNFCPVLAAGLSGLYSTLPRRLEFRGDEFCSLERYHWENVSSLRSFMQSLLFINSVCELAEPQVLKSLLSFLHSGFLVPVLGPSLHNTNPEESLCSTAYLELFIRSITSKPLLKCLLQFIVLHEHEGVPIIETLTQRLASNHRQCLAALSLFSTLISINCEDFMFQLILRYLIPCTHMLWTQRNLIRQNEQLVFSADKFLNLTPKMLIKRQQKNEVFRINEDLSFAAGDGSSKMNKEDEEELEEDLLMFGAAPGAIDQIETSYMDYLEDAQIRIEEANYAISSWLYKYDGLNPSPNFFEETKNLLSPVPKIVEQKTKPLLEKFLAENSIEGDEGVPMSLEQLGISISTEDNETLPPLESLLAPQSDIIKPSDQPPAESKPTNENPPTDSQSEKKKSLPPKTEVDHFYRALMDDFKTETGIEPNEEIQLDDSIEETRDFSKTEELFEADLVAVENSIVTVGSDENENEIHESEALRLDEPEVETQLEIEPEVVEENNENSILELSAVEEQLSDLSDDSFLDATHTTIQLPVKLSGAPYLGSFLSTLFGRLEQMPTNSLYLNLMLTGLLSQLASLPIPLIRGLLLDTRIIYQSGVPSLFQVLSRVKGKIEAFASSCPDYTDLCDRASQFLIQRESQPFKDNYDVTVKEELKDQFKKIEKKIKKKAEEAEKAILAAKLNHDMRQKYSPSQSESLRIRNNIYASIVLKEFSKELASLSHEHSLRL